MAMDRRRADEPTGARNFSVQIDGVDLGCSAVLGLGLESRDGLVAPLTLRRAASTDLTWWRWAREPRACTVTITLLDLEHSPVCRYVLLGAVPEQWRGPALDGLSDEVATEELVLRAEGLEVEPVG